MVASSLSPCACLLRSWFVERMPATRRARSLLRRRPTSWPSCDSFETTPPSGGKVPRREKGKSRATAGWRFFRREHFPNIAINCCRFSQLEPCAELSRSLSPRRNVSPSLRDTRLGLTDETLPLIPPGVTVTNPCQTVEVPLTQI